jgi:hypothetical protein
MGYGLMVYSVDLDKILAVMGSGDDRVRKAISGRFKDHIMEINTVLCYSNDRGDPSVLRLFAIL